MSFSAVVVSHANETGLRKMLGNLMYQTVKPDETLVYVSGLERPALVELQEDFPHTEVFLCVDRQDWGHEKRSQGLARASKEWVGFFNDDDHYNLSYLEKMLEAGREADAVYCGWNVIRKPRFCLGSSTSGNFIVRTKIAKKVGYSSRAYEADGHFIDAVRSSGARVVFVDEVLYAHNYQP